MIRYNGEEINADSYIVGAVTSGAESARAI
jgi:hypothetical protein